MKLPLPLTTQRASRAQGSSRHIACNGTGQRTPWTRAQIAALGVESDAAIALDVGCCAHTVARERRRRGIAAPTIGDAGTLQDLDGARVTARRWKLNLSQTELGELLGCNASRVSHLENGASRQVRTQTLLKLAGALDCPPADLLRR